MKRFVEGVARDQGGLFPAHLDGFVIDTRESSASGVFAIYRAAALGDLRLELGHLAERKVLMGLADGVDGPRRHQSVPNWCRVEPGKGAVREKS